MNSFDKKDVLLLEDGGVHYNIYLPGKDIDYIQKKIYNDKIPYEIDMLNDIKYRLQNISEPLVLDIGANIGNHTLFLAANNILVKAFEVNIDLYNIMNKSIEINNFKSRVESYNIGISDEHGVAKFSNKNEENLGGQSLKIGEGDIKLKPIKSITINRRVSAIKIDVEGMEINVIKGALDLINKDKPLLYIEAINLNEFKRIYLEMEKLSYVYWETFNATPTHLFIPKENIKEKDLISKNLSKNIYETYRMTQQLNYSKRLDNRLEKILNILNQKVLMVEDKNVKLVEKDITQRAEIVKLDAIKKQLEEKIELYEVEKEEFQKHINKSSINYKGIVGRYEKEKEKYHINLAGLKYRNKKLLLEVEKVKTSLSNRWGNRMIESRKSFISFIFLPYFLYKEYKVFKKKSNNKVIKKIEGNIFKSKKETIDLNLKGLKVASIMDEFTYNSFRYECDLFQVTPIDWKKELEIFKPDLLFIESAWKGKDDLWATKISNCTEELIKLVQWCYDNKISVMFWNKEDPVHFDTFIPVAKIVDFVFTTDIDCVPRYKNEVGHENVYFLPFAAQPIKHNPLEIYDRKDAFNFAGSYYLRYPERQKDFASLIEAVKNFKRVDIYDRNFDNPHPHYTFPDEYKPMILGKLPFEEIDKAYKGYKYGINMNTIKQSQSMFARRVFELLASNTIVVSNFSRGVRLLFGDLVISSDNSNELENRLDNICNNDLNYRKLRLLGLRKVMAEHTYAQRLAFIVSKINKKTFETPTTSVLIYAVAKNKDELSSIVKSFEKQTYSNKKLVVSITKEIKTTIINQDIRVFDKALLNESIFLEDKNALFGIMNSDDYYGENYITDLAYTSFYSDADAYGKSCHYSYSEDIILNNDTIQYKSTKKLYLESSLVKLSSLDESEIKSYINGKIDIEKENMLAIDEFNYCKNGNLVDLITMSIVDDLDIVDKGISFTNKLATVSDSLEAREKVKKDDSTLPSVEAKKLFDMFTKPVSNKIKLSFTDENFTIVTKLGVGKHAYIYLKKVFTREEINMVLNSQFTLESSNTLEDMRTVFEFQDKEGKKIAHSMNPAGKTYALAIPRECKYIRFGLKLVGNGKANISKLVLGTHGEVPLSIVGKSKKLVLTKQYPSYDDIYKYGFLHSRVRAYKKEGLLVDVFRINHQPQKPYREFEGVDVVTGDAKLLEETLKTGLYDHVLVHLIDQNMWKVLEQFIDKIKVTIWVHGAEIQVWQQRDFEFSNMNADEIDRQKKLSNQRVKFWKILGGKENKNLHFVFVSKWLKDSSEKLLKIKFQANNYSLIHNNIDSKIFDYKEKVKEDRLHILSIRPYAKRVYANDLTVKAILLLSNRRFFNELKFTIVGDGELFDKTIKPLKDMKNVKIEKKFLQHFEISKLHKKHGIFLVPTRMDTQGVSRDEAMSSGLVPITTNITAIPEFVDDSCGMVVEPENPQALADAIEYLYMNPDEFLKLSKSASERVENQCGLEQTVMKEIELIV